MSQDGPASRAGPSGPLPLVLAWPRQVPLYVLLIGAAAAIATVAALLVSANTGHRRQLEAARLEAVADLRASQVNGWLREATAQARFAGRSPMGEAYVRWRDQGDPQARPRLLERMASLKDAVHAQAILVYGEGVALSTEGDVAHPPPASLADAIREAMERRQPVFAWPRGAGSTGPLAHVDVAVPLASAGNPPRAALVIRLSPQESLLPMLRQWPLPSRTGTSSLVRREGDRLVGPEGRRPLPVDSPGLLVSEVMSGRAPAGKAVDAKDFRGVRVLGVVRPVEGTPWHLVARVDADEAYAEARRDALWLATGALLAFLAVAATAYLLRERQRLHRADLQQQLQRERLRALELFGAIAEGSTDVICAKDNQGRYLMMNRRGCEALGRAEGEIVGRDDLALFPAPLAEMMRTRDEEVHQEDRHVTYQMDAPTTQGERTFLTTKGPLHDSEGRVTGVFGIARDITELQRYRQRLEDLVRERTRELDLKNQALQRTVDDLEAFSYSVSHDLRGPLKTINGFATVLDRTEARALSDDGRRKLARVIDGARRMDQMIEDILRCSRAERLQMRLEPVDLAGMVRDLVADAASHHPGTRAEVGPLPVLEVDPTVAHQVLANLIANAFKFSSRQASPLVEIGVAEPGPQPLFYVRDNGVGFDAAQADQLFVPFRRLHPDDQFAGTGVGLSIVHRLLERHGGHIRAESRPGVRTQFTFRFGVPPQEPTASPRDTERAPGPSA